MYNFVPVGTVSAIFDVSVVEANHSYVLVNQNIKKQVNVINLLKCLKTRDVIFIRKGYYYL